MVSNPAVSVVMTVYNTEQYLALAIDSILAQTYEDFEFIVIDDGSTDRSADIVRDYATRDGRIRLTSRPNTGVVRAANEGIGQARGKYLARMDSDDISMPHRFARQVSYLDANPDCVLVGSRVQIVDPYGSPVAVSGQKLAHEDIDAELLTSGGGWAVVQPSAMMRLDAVRQAGGYRGSVNMSEDHDLFLRLAERGKVANLSEPVLQYRRHYKSLNHTQYEKAWQVKEAILREAYERRGRPFPNDWKDDPWRPPEKSEQLRLWGWAAIKAGNRRVARKHAMGALAAAPLSAQAWRLMYCAIRGR
jgi:glycosyltransferase involved in cell wall biosynthesis